MQAYSNPERASEPTALPDVEVFHVSESDVAKRNNASPSFSGEELTSGWYWHACFPGCLPDSEPNGPFETEAEALADAQSMNE